MPWLKIDDQYAFHKKVLQAGNEAVGAWTRLGSWSSAHLSDGVVPSEIIDLVMGERREEILARLLKAVLLESHGVDYVIHDYLDYNPSGEEVIAKREKDAKRKKGKRGSKRASKRESTRTPVDSSQESARTQRGGSSASSSPDPTRPDPYPGSLALASDARAIPVLDSGPMPPDPPELKLGRPVSEFQTYWGQRTGVLSPDGQALREAHARLAMYAAQASVDGTQVQDRALDALEAIVGSWSDTTHKSLTPQRFNAKWDEIQGILSGKVKPPAKRVPDPMAIGERPDYSKLP